MDSIPFGDAGKRCTLKELRDRAYWWGTSVDKTSLKVLTTWNSYNAKYCKVHVNNNNEKLRIGVLHWDYTESDVRKEYARSNSVPVLNIAHRYCNEYCEYVLTEDASQPNVDLLLVSATDHGRAFGGPWCTHAYPFAHVPDSTLLGNWAFEHLQQFPQLADPVLLRRLDMQVNFHPQSSVPITGFCPGEIDAKSNFTAYFKPVNVATKQHLVAAVASRCRNDWQEYVNELLVYLPNMQTYGKCWGNLQQRRAMGPSYRDKVSELSKSKFTLVFENTKQISHYVSEKLSHAILANTVPVIWGAPNIAQYLPSNHSAIVASNNAEFEHSPRKLAEYLVYLDNNPKAYLEYFAWKRDPAAQAKLYELTSNCQHEAGCRICDWVRKRKQECE